MPILDQRTKMIQVGETGVCLWCMIWRVQTSWRWVRGRWTPVRRTSKVRRSCWRASPTATATSGWSGSRTGSRCRRVTTGRHWDWITSRRRTPASTSAWRHETTSRSRRTSSASPSQVSSDSGAVPCFHTRGGGTLSEQARHAASTFGARPKAVLRGDAGGGALSRLKGSGNFRRQIVHPESPNALKLWKNVNMTGQI